MPVARNVRSIFGLDPNFTFGGQAPNAAAAAMALAPQTASSVAPRQASGRGETSASLFASGSREEANREAQRLAQGRGMSFEQGLALAPVTTTTGVSAGGVPFPTHDTSGNPLLSTSKLIPIFQTNWMKNIPKNSWGPNGEFNLPSPAAMLEQLKQPEWTKEETVLPMGPDPIDWAGYTRGKGQGLTQSVPGKNWSNLNHIYLPVNKDTREPLIDVPAGWRPIPNGTPPREPPTATNTLLSRFANSSTGGAATDFARQLMPLLAPFYGQTEAPSKKTITIPTWKPPNPAQSSPSGLFGLDPAQSIPI